MHRIGISLTHLDPNRMGGAETYCRKLVEQLQRLDCTDLRFFLFVGRGCELPTTNDAFENIQLPINPSRRMLRILLEQVIGPVAMERYSPSLVHFPYCTSPYLWSGNSVVTIHDSQRFVLPRLTEPFESRYRDVIEASQAERGMHVISVSNWDASSMRNWLALSRSQTSVIHCGVDEKFYNCAIDGKQQYLLWVGRPYERKDVETIIRALGTLRKQGRTLVPLRVIGASAEYHARLNPVIKEANVADLVSLEPFVPHGELTSLYRDAAIFCYPSRYESFGIPVLEAMAAGVPVVCSDIPAFDEIAGDYATQCPVGDVDVFAKAIGDLIEQPDLRKQQADRGRPWAQQFTWGRCAAQTLAVYRSLL